jgi:hypothetical protein
MANAPLAKVLAVIELKGTNTTDLSRVETQAFGYKNNQPGCNYVITSNFEKLRFYIDNAVEFEEFNLFQLSKERFNTLYLCLSAEYLLNDIPKNYTKIMHHLGMRFLMPYRKKIPNTTS